MAKGELRLNTFTWLLSAVFLKRLWWDPKESLHVSMIDTT